MTTRTFTAADWLSAGLTDAELHDEEDDILDTEPLPTDEADPWQTRQRLTAGDWRTLVVTTVVILLLGVLLAWVCFPGQPDLAVDAWLQALLPGVVLEWAVILLVVKMRGQL